MDIYLPVTRGEQAGTTIFSAMVTYAELSQVFIFDDSDLPIEMRQQRDINEKRAGDFFKYMADNENSYVSGSLTGTYDEAVEFIPLQSSFASGRLGVLKIPSTSKITLSDGQHRQSGIRQFFEAFPEQGNQSIPVKLYFANNIERKQQIFADINGYTVKPSSSLAITFDHRNLLNSFIKDVLKEVPEIKARVEMSKSSVGKNSSKLWPMASFKKTLCYLMGMSERAFAEEVQDDELYAEIKAATVSFLKGLSNLPLWDDMLHGNLNLAETRQDFIVSHAVFLEALGVYGNTLFSHFDANQGVDWSKMEALQSVDVKKLAPVWRGRCVNINGTMNKSVYGVKTSAAAICNMANLELSEDLLKFDEKAKQSLIEQAGA